MAYPEIETTLVALLSAQFTDARLCTELPADLTDVLPVIQVGRISGADDGFKLDSPIVDVDVFGASRDGSRSLAYQVRDYLVGLRNQQVNGCVITRFETEMAPVWTPYDDTNVRKFTASYLLHTHS